MRHYAVKEVFATLQGEGALAGTPAVFVRLSGCNLWSGDDGTRERDAVGNAASCPRWCDTSFAHGAPHSAEELAVRVRACATDHPPLLVLTGGEPLLQIDRALVDVLRSAGGFRCVAVETNGTAAFRDGGQTESGVDWVCVSPKTEPGRVVVRSGEELKVVFPGGLRDPEQYAGELGAFGHYFVSPCADVSAVGDSSPSAVATAEAVEYVQRHPRWRLSLQTHKMIGLR